MRNRRRFQTHASTSDAFGSAASIPTTARSSATDAALTTIPGWPSRQLPAWQVRLIKASRRTLQRLRWYLHIRRGVLVNGCWYKETSAIPLHKALLDPPRGPGFKEYRVTFPDGEKLVVRCTKTDILADLMGSVGLDCYYKVADSIRPGMRVLEIGAGSGYRAAWLSRMVSASGSVVAICSCREMSAFAQKRYGTLPVASAHSNEMAASANIAFEVGSPQTLAGETDGAFDMVFVSGLLGEDDDSDALLAEVYRVTRPGGRLILHVLAQPLTVASGALARADERGRLEAKPPDEVLALEARLTALLARQINAHDSELSRSNTWKPHVTYVCAAADNVLMLAVDRPELME